MGRNCSTASSTVTSLPRRRQTLPSSKPMTAGADDAEAGGNGVEFQSVPGIDDEFPVVRHGLQRMGVEPEASITCVACRVFSVPSAEVTSTLFAGQQAPVALGFRSRRSP